jgi:ribosomal protein L7/L12
MNIRTPAPVDPQKLEEIHTLLASCSNLDDVISRMRSLGLNKIECIKVIRAHLGVSLGEAKDIVHLSPAWADRFDSDNALHDAFEQAAEIEFATQD